ncbi:xanthine dehydrogenase family protein molybdopterin-binding subunit [Novosphingobium profundi]|uniref:xanthine dehydrogenase family protein molybdopterin-binding subunit n=1 Tax=Novosphingobium profundi TaxID=1774954 RepID=UPI001CFCB366|nr:molybdopterin cofactor-binding domain-containing protein [Novosphingobium profundi]
MRHEPDTSSPRAHAGLDRRRFVSLSATALVLGIMAPKLARGATPDGAQSLARAQEDAPHLASPFLSIDAQGTVTVYAKHLDMGQGIWTGLATILAEELDANWEQVRVEGAPARLPDYVHLDYGAQTTGGSTSIAQSWQQLREAGANARAMLVAAAAARWQVPAGDITVANGVVRAGERSAHFGELAAEAGAQDVPEASPKPRSAYSLVGQRALGALDARAKSTGRQLYAIDGGWPGLKVALLARPPRLGARVARFDASAAKAMPGVRAVVEIPGGLAVVADGTWQAMKARDALDITWDESAASTTSSQGYLDTLAEAMDSAEPEFSEERGDSAAAFAKAAQVLEAEFTFPYLAHAPMEPLTSMGRIEDGECYLRAGFQSQTINQQAAAEILGVPTEKVHLETIAAGGSFGRRAAADSDWICELAQVLKATQGRWPIKLMRTREDEMAAMRYRPQALHRLRAALDDTGRPTAIEHGIGGEGVFPHLLKIAPEVHRFSVILGNAFEQYDFPAGRLDWWRADLDIPVETYRGIANNHTAPAKEIFVDRLARAAKADPLAFRLNLLAERPRAAGVLRRAAAMVDWDSPAPEGITRGVAVQFADETHIAQIAEVSGTPEDYRIERIVCAVDLGLAINPDIVRAQIEGGIAFALSNTFVSELTVENGAAVQSNFHDYPIQGMYDMPRRIEVAIVDSEEAPTGIGEPGSLLAGAAVINALERMGAKPVTSFPYRPV